MIFIYFLRETDISTLVKGDANDVIEHDRKTSELSNAALHTPHEIE